MDETKHREGGGFLLPSLPSPAPSASSSQVASSLPHPRSQALRAGGIKELKVRKYVEERLLHISRRYVKKFGIPEPGDDVVGYDSMKSLCKDVQGIINLLWRAGTPSLQIPYFLYVANEMNTWLDSFAFSPKATFSVLRKLDHCFASLMSGTDIDTGETLPGFEQGLKGGLSRTDMVRCQSVVAQTRVLIVDVMNRGDADEEEEDDDDAPTDAEGGSTTEDAVPSTLWDDDDTVYMEVGRVYEHTIVKLGELLGEGNVVLDES